MGLRLIKHFFSLKCLKLCYKNLMTSKNNMNQEMNLNKKFKNKDKMRNDFNNIYKSYIFVKFKFLNNMIKEPKIFCIM